MKAFIIEDDISTAIEYERIFADCGIVDVTVLGDYLTAKENIDSQSPDITILDVYLKESSTIDLIPSLNATGSDIIMVTGFTKEEIIKAAVDFNVVNFLPKPVNPHTLEFQIQAIAKRKATELHESFCFVKSKNNYKRIPYQDIQFLETEGNYTSIYTESGKFILKKSLKNVAEGLPAQIFTRVHRNFMINNNHVINLDLKNNQIEMHHEKLISIGGKYRNDIKKTIGEKFNVI